jgi:hypothetical protein
MEPFLEDENAAFVRTMMITITQDFLKARMNQMLRSHTNRRCQYENRDLRHQVSESEDVSGCSVQQIDAYSLRAY